MRKQDFLYFLFLILILWSCYTNEDEIIFKKNECYESKLKLLQNNILYKRIHSQFRDTFGILKKEIEYFGVSDYVDNRIDNALFLKKDSSECLMIVLQKRSDTLSFGSARIIRGEKDLKRWVFSPSIHISFDIDYFNLFNENTFENISKIARYSVMKNGKVKVSGCEIDENWWFVHLKD